MRFQFLRLTIGLLLTLAAFADNEMAGRWTGTMGLVVIPAGGGHFTLKAGPNDFPADWVVAGKEFSWTDKQGKRHKATLEPNPKPTAERPTRIRDVGEAYPDSPGFWYRVP